MRRAIELLCFSLVMALGCDDRRETDAGPDDAGAGTDAGADAGVAIDAGEDAGPPEVGPAHCLGIDLLIAAVDPNTSITLFNPTSDTIAIDDFNYVLCRKPDYPPVADLEAGVVIAPGESHTFPWPPTLDDDDDTAGEIALYNFPSFTNSTAQIDYVCWGGGIADGRRNVAESDGEWSGGCAPAITGEALRRVPDTDGRSAASYDATGTAAALACP